MTFLTFLSSYFDHLAQQRRAATAAQAQQSPAQAFAAAWNGAQLRLPADYIYTVEDPVTGAVAEAVPWCDAAVDTTGCLRLALTVPPDAPIDAATMAEHVEAVRQLARAFFQVGLRLTDVDPRRQTLQLVFSPVRPQVDARGVILLGFDDTGSPVGVSLIGEVTAISGAGSLCIPWLAASYSAIDRQALDPQTAIASTRAAVRQARAGADVPYMFIDIGDASCAETARPESLKNLDVAHRGIIEWSRGDASADAWSIRPTQILRREGTEYVLEKSSRAIRFTPAWRY